MEAPWRPLGGTRQVGRGPGCGGREPGAAGGGTGGGAGAADPASQTAPGGSTLGLRSRV